MTDGERVDYSGPRHFRPYSDAERRTLRTAVEQAKSLNDRTARPGALADAERIVTEAHADAIDAIRKSGNAPVIDLIGFHGQTVFHAPERGLTVQIGDGAALARRFGIPVVYDFRAADMAAGGQGAPLVPAYHRALALNSGLDLPLAVVNIGGVANLTWLGPGGSMSAYDTGPGNALLDDLARTRAGRPMDEGGALAAAGKVDERALRRLTEHPYFAAQPPKSLDRNAFSIEPVAALPPEHAAATLTEFTAATIADAVKKSGGATQIVVAGGGARNPVRIERLRKAARAPVVTAEDLGWSADFLEAEAFAFLAARAVAGLPLTWPETTGVPLPMTGGVVARP
jgi:anhydro-N-acetylmuramic acid kinase